MPKIGNPAGGPAHKPQWAKDIDAGIDARAARSRLLLSPIGGDLATHNAPVPWRIVKSHTAAQAIVDAEGRTVTVCSNPAVAGRIVAAVNMVECAHREDTP